MKEFHSLFSELFLRDEDEWFIDKFVLVLFQPIDDRLIFQLEPHKMSLGDRIGFGPIPSFP